MRTYKNKDELKREIHKSFEKYISEFDIIPDSLNDKRIFYRFITLWYNDKKRRWR